MHHKSPRSTAGFTILEVIVVVAIIGLISVTALEAMRTYGPRFELRQNLSQTTQLINKARIEAIKRGVTTVVEANIAERTLTAFADVNGDPNDPARAGALYLVYDPNPLASFDRTDYLIGEVDLPGKAEAGVQFGDPIDGINGAGSVDGFTTRTAGDPGVLVFRSTGSVLDPGAFRFADARGLNFFETSVAAITGKIEHRKYLKLEDSPNSSAGYFPEANRTYDTAGEETTVGDNLWVWY